VRQPHRFLEDKPLLGDLDDRSTRALKLLEEGELVRVALPLQKLSLVAVVAGRHVADLDQPKVERRRVAATLEAHQIRGRKPHLAIDDSHALPLLQIMAYRG